MRYPAPGVALVVFILILFVHLPCAVKRGAVLLAHLQNPVLRIRAKTPLR